MGRLKIPVYKFVRQDKIAQEQDEGAQSVAPGILRSEEKLDNEEPSGDVVDRHEDDEEEISHAPPGCRCFESSHGEEEEPGAASDAAAADSTVVASDCADATGEGSVLADPGRAGEMGGSGIFWPSRTRPAWQSWQIRGRCLKIFPPPRQL
jgi:hypothetical protein